MKYRYYHRLQSTYLTYYVLQKNMLRKKYLPLNLHPRLMHTYSGQLLDIHRCCIMLQRGSPLMQNQLLAQSLVQEVQWSLQHPVYDSLPDALVFYFLIGGMTSNHLKSHQTHLNVINCITKLNHVLQIK